MVCISTTPRHCSCYLRYDISAVGGSDDVKFMAASFLGVDNHWRQLAWEAFYIPGICPTVLIRPLLPFLRRPSLKLKISFMRNRSISLSLQDDEQYRADDWYEVERQIHEVADDGCRSKLRKR